MSKRFIAFSLLLILTSACTRQVVVPTPVAVTVRPVFSNTVESNPTATSTPLILVGTEQSVPATDVDCPGAPVPHVVIGQQVTVIVEDFDSLKLREIPEISPDTEVMDLSRSTQLKILEGPVCVSSTDPEVSYWFWKVEVLPNGEIGWVAEGDSLDYFIETASEQPVTTPDASCSSAPVSRVAVGQEVTVVVDDTDKLKLRESPEISPDTEVRGLDKFTQLKILEGPVCVASTDPEVSYWFWKVEVISTGEVGWVAEGDSLNYFIE